MISQIVDLCLHNVLWMVERQEVEIDDAVTCAFPGRDTSRKGYVA